jgi:hypothetical protein
MVALKLHNVIFHAHFLSCYHLKYFYNPSVVHRACEVMWLQQTYLESTTQQSLLSRYVKALNCTPLSLHHSCYTSNTVGLLCLFRSKQVNVFSKTVQFIVNYAFRSVRGWLTLFKTVLLFGKYFNIRDRKVHSERKMTSGTGELNILKRGFCNCIFQIKYMKTAHRVQTARPTDMHVTTSQ